MSKELCACGKQKKIISIYCLQCGNEINNLRGRLKSAKSKENEEKIKQMLKDKLLFHSRWKEPIKTKTTKMREKRSIEKTLN